MYRYQEIKILILVLFRYMAQGGIAGSYANSSFTFLEELYFTQWWGHFLSPPIVHKGFNISTSFPILTLFFWIVTILNGMRWLLTVVLLFWYSLRNKNGFYSSKLLKKNKDKVIIWEVCDIQITVLLVSLAHGNCTHISYLNVLVAECFGL